jgi:hypothetical protein
MNSRTILCSLALTSAAGLSACGGAPPGDPVEKTSDSQQDIKIFTDPCAYAPPDVYTDLANGMTFDWEWNLPSYVVTSGSGFYGAPYNGRTCLSFIADFEVHIGSNAIWSAELNQWIGYPIIAFPGAWDLPSSGADEVAPGNPVDAARETTVVSWYSKNVGDASFAFTGVSYRIAGGVTKAGTVPAGGFPLGGPQIGAPDIVYRAVVSVLERTSFQEVRVVLTSPQPQ